jgi:hypothetical protein
MAVADLVATLRRRITTDRDLSKFWDYFLDNVAKNVEFQAAGEPCAAPRLEDSLQLIGRSVFGKPSVRITNAMWLLLPEHGLIHGTCTVEKRLAMALYFPEEKVGIAGIHRQGSNVVYARFTPPDLSRIPTKSAVQ